MKYRLQKYSCGDYQAGYEDSISVVSTHNTISDGLAALRAEKIEEDHISWIHYELVSIFAINDGRGPHEHRAPV